MPIVFISPEQPVLARRLAADELSKQYIFSTKLFKNDRNHPQENSTLWWQVCWQPQSIYAIMGQDFERTPSKGM